MRVCILTFCCECSTILPPVPVSRAGPTFNDDVQPTTLSVLPPLPNLPPSPKNVVPIPPLPEAAARKLRRANIGSKPFQRKVGVLPAFGRIQEIPALPPLPGNNSADSNTSAAPFSDESSWEELMKGLETLPPLPPQMRRSQSLSSLLASSDGEEATARDSSAAGVGTALPNSALTSGLSGSDAGDTPAHVPFPIAAPSVAHAPSPARSERRLPISAPTANQAGPTSVPGRIRRNSVAHGNAPVLPRTRGSGMPSIHESSEATETSTLSSSQDSMSTSASVGAMLRDQPDLAAVLFSAEDVARSDSSSALESDHSETFEAFLQRLNGKESRNAFNN